MLWLEYDRTMSMIMFIYLKCDIVREINWFDIVWAPAVDAIYNMSGLVVSGCMHTRAEGESCICDTTRTEIVFSLWIIEFHNEYLRFFG